MTTPDLPRATFEARDFATQYNAPGGTQIFGFTGPEVLRLVELAKSPEAADHAELARVLKEQISTEAPVERSAVATFLSILGEREVPTERLATALEEIAQRHLSLLQRLQTLTGDDPEVTTLRQRAAEAIQRGDYESADALLDEADNTDARAIEEQQQALTRRRLSRATTLSERGEIALTTLRYRDAADHFQAAANLLAPDETYREKRLAYATQAANALVQQADERGDITAFGDAIEAF